MHLRRRKSNTEVLLDHVQDLAERAADLGEQAVLALAPLVEEARHVASGAYDQARVRVREDLVPKVRDEYVPKVREEVGDRFRNDVMPKAKAAAASPLVAAALAKSPIELTKPTPAPEQTHRVRNSVVALGLGGGVAYAATKLRGGSSSTSGSSYTPPQPPARPTAVPDPVPAAPPSSDVSVGVDPAPATGPGDGPTMDDLGGDVIYPEVGYSEEQTGDDRRPGDPASPTQR